METNEIVHAIDNIKMFFFPYDLQMLNFIILIWI